MTPQGIDGVLLDFGDWLRQAAVRVAAGEREPAPGPEFSWQTLVGEFTALRHEVHLQTRNSRTQLEQNATALTRLGNTLEALEQSHEREAEHAETQAADAAKPLLKTLVDAFDALALAKREVERVRSALTNLLEEKESSATAEDRVGSSPQPEPVQTSSRSWWPWRSARKDSDAGQAQKIAEVEAMAAALRQEVTRLRGKEEERQRVLAKASDLVNSILTGYSMGLERIERATSQHGLIAIACVGQPFDPECMEVVEVVAVPGQDGTMVVEEIRRGYWWNERVFRFAQVRVARPG